MTLPALHPDTNTNSFSLSPRTPATLSMSSMSFTHEEEELSEAMEQVRRLLALDEMHEIIPQQLRHRYRGAAKQFLRDGVVDTKLPAFVFQFLKSHRVEPEDIKKLRTFVGRHPTILTLRAQKKKRSEKNKRKKKKKKKKKKTTQSVVVVAAVTPIDLTGSSDSEDENDVVINNNNVNTIAVQPRLSPGDKVQIINEFALPAGPSDRPHAFIHAINSPGERQTYDIYLTCSVKPEENVLWAPSWVDGRFRKDIKPLYLKRFPSN
jgi:hypothetical protein